MEKILQKLQKINWDFSDYNSSKYPLDINSIPWYPATFIPPIPKFLIALLSKQGDTILDPFGGKGTTVVEAIKQCKIPIYNDLNPFATEISQAIVAVIKQRLLYPGLLKDESNLLSLSQVQTSSISEFMNKNNIGNDVFHWYEPETLKELLGIINLINKEKEVNADLFLIRKLALSSILKSASSQPGHFTYVTDNCKPEHLVYKGATKLYTDRINQIIQAVDELICQFTLINPTVNLETILEKSQIHTGDAKDMSWIESNTVNLVLTSPPYLCAQDYIKTMRLTNMFFPNKDFDEKPKKEIGPRNKRRSKSKFVVEQFYSDMNSVFAEIYRVLIKDGFFCFIFGQGKAKIAASYDTIGDLKNDIMTRHSFDLVYSTQRKISSRVIQVGGVDKEMIFVFQKKALKDK